MRNMKRNADNVLMLCQEANAYERLLNYKNCSDLDMRKDCFISYSIPM